ncbi:capsular polysaccharide synthesis protein [Janibacter sp. GXQ6167]|uniref:capsular polysaccharide synthesis protein n=1 Tax=Janibacter sp. GXQ6167 TaxID=3240791 RepID=UPI003525B62E
MPWADRARRVKHAGFLARKRAYRGYIQARDLSFAAYNTIVPYQFDPEQHKDAWGDFPRMYFLDRDPPPGVSGDRSVPRQIFTLWTGDNEMSPNRIAGLTSLQSRNPDIPIIHVTPDNLSEYVVDEHPIHPAYQHLSLVHRSDYLRAYFMHHHGGGYSDIKSTSHSWTAAFDRITREKILWIIGYQVPSSSACGGRDPRLGVPGHQVGSSAPA